MEQQVGRKVEMSNRDLMETRVILQKAEELRERAFRQLLLVEGEDEVMVYKPKMYLMTM